MSRRRPVRAAAACRPRPGAGPWTRWCAGARRCRPTTSRRSSPISRRAGGTPSTRRASNGSGAPSRSRRSRVWVALVAAFTLLWPASLPLKNASIVDMWWGPAFVLAAALYAGAAPAVGARALAVLAVVALWALRLAWHIGRRNVGHGEDPALCGLARAARRRAGGGAAGSRCSCCRRRSRGWCRGRSAAAMRDGARLRHRVGCRRTRRRPRRAVHRSGGRRPTPSLQAHGGARRGLRRRAVALLAPPQLLRRVAGLVGAVPGRLRGARRLGQRREPGAHHLAAAAGVGRDDARGRAWPRPSQATRSTSAAPRPSCPGRRRDERVSATRRSARPHLEDEQQRHARRQRDPARQAIGRTESP